MNLYIWNFVAHLTPNYHNGGGLVVAHTSLEEARKFAKLEGEGREKPCEALTKAPDRTLALQDGCEPFVEYFPDSGCC